MARRVTLESLTFTFRCQESWTDMDGGGAVRHCGSCDKDVFDLSALPRAEAEALLRDTEGRICVRLFRTPDGRVVTADDAPLSRPVATCGSFSSLRLKPRRRALWRRLSSGAAAAAVVLQPGACEETVGDVSEPVIQPLMGQMMMGEPMMIEEPSEPAHAPMMGRIAFEPIELDEDPAVLEAVSAEDLHEPQLFEELGDIGYLE